MNGWAGFPQFSPRTGALQLSPRPVGEEDRGDLLSPLSTHLQVSQYVSRAEELKALVSSSNQTLLKQGASARDLLRGRPPWDSWAPRAPA